MKTPEAIRAEEMFPYEDETFKETTDHARACYALGLLDGARAERNAVWEWLELRELTDFDEARLIEFLKGREEK